MVSLCHSLFSFHVIFLHTVGLQGGSESRGVEYFHLNKRSVLALDFAAGLAFGGHRLRGDTCL